MSIKDHDPSSTNLCGDAEKAEFTKSANGLANGSPDPPHNSLRRQLKNRHITMISIGGVIGTGLFLSTATALRNGGPLGLLLGYSFLGSICYCIMTSLGEMVSYLPIPGGHIKLAERFVGRAFSFALGWTYWYNWTIVLPTELTAAAILIDFWDRDTKMNSAWVAMCLVVVMVINFMGAGAYGEAEFIFASIKVFTITGLIILGIILDLGGGPDRDRLGFRYWKHPGPFVQYDGIAGAKGRFLGFWAVLIQAAFSFVGTEIVAIAAAEAKNPRRNMPKAIRRVYVRISLFYIGGVAIIGLLVPSNNPGLKLDSGSAASPFVIAIKRSGIKVLPGLINGCLLSSAWSAASSDLYSSSRALYGLAIAGNAPSIFKKTLRNGLPVTSLIFCSSFSLLAFMGVHAGSSKVFGWFSNMISVSGLVSWCAISWTYIRFYAGMKAQGIDRKGLPFSSPLQPYLAWYSLVSCLAACLFSGWSVFLRGKWNTADFVTNYMPLVIFPILYAASKFWTGASIVRASEMDFFTGLAEVEASSYEDPPPRNRLEAFWQWLM